MSDKQETAVEIAQEVVNRIDDEALPDRTAWNSVEEEKAIAIIAAAIEAAVGRERKNVDWVLDKIKVCHPEMLEGVTETMPDRLYCLMHLLSNYAGMYKRYVATRRTDVGELQNEVERLQADLAAAEQHGREATLNAFERWGMERDEPEVSYAARWIREGSYRPESILPGGALPPQGW